MRPSGTRVSTSTVVICLCSVVAVACSEGTRESGMADIFGDSVQIVFSDHAARTVDLRDRLPHALIGPESATVSPDLFRVRAAAILPDNGLAVANSGLHQVLFFQTGGSYIGTVGRQGRGPDEFMLLLRLWVNGDSLITFDAGNGRFTVRRLDGELVRTFRPERVLAMFEPVSMMGSTVIAANSSGLTGDYQSGVSIDSVIVSQHDLSGGLVREYGRFPYHSRMAFSADGIRTTLQSPFTVRGSFVAYMRGFCHTFGTLAEISCLDAESGIPWLIIRPNAEPRRVTEAHIAEYWEDALTTDNVLRRSMLNRLREEIPFPEYLPAYRSLHVDSSEQIWAGVFPESDSEYGEWHVFKDGRWEASVVAPPGFRIMDVRGRWLIGVREDELGVESLAVYDLDGIL